MTKKLKMGPLKSTKKKPEPLHNDDAMQNNFFGTTTDSKPKVPEPIYSPGQANTFSKDNRHLMRSLGSRDATGISQISPTMSGEKLEDDKS